MNCNSLKTYVLNKLFERKRDEPSHYLWRTPWFIQVTWDTEIQEATMSWACS